MTIQHTDDLEDDLAKILQDEIWKEITAETGKTRNDLDNEIVATIVGFYKNQIEDNSLCLVCRSPWASCGCPR